MGSASGTPQHSPIYPAWAPEPLPEPASAWPLSPAAEAAVPGAESRSACRSRWGRNRKRRRYGCSLVQRSSSQRWPAKQVDAWYPYLSGRFPDVLRALMLVYSAPASGELDGNRGGGASGVGGAEAKIGANGVRGAA